MKNSRLNENLKKACKDGNGIRTKINGEFHGPHLVP